jgi:hypothetical protein
LDQKNAEINSNYAFDRKCENSKSKFLLISSVISGTKDGEKKKTKHFLTEKEERKRNACWRILSAALSLDEIQFAITVSLQLDCEVSQREREIKE